MDCALFAILGAIWGGLIISSFLPNYNESQLLDNAKQIIKECESTIPRNQTCQLKAVVKEEVK